MEIPRRTPMALYVGWLMMFVEKETCGVRSDGCPHWCPCQGWPLLCMQRGALCVFCCVVFPFPLGFLFLDGEDVMDDERVCDLQGWCVFFQCFIEDSLGVFRLQFFAPEDF
eukprot:12867596-Ditylum_brightwellii.AAC.1